MTSDEKLRRPQLTQQLLFDLDQLVSLAAAQHASDPKHQRKLGQAAERVGDFLSRHRAWKRRPR
jgi:hypothetical protein